MSEENTTGEKIVDIMTAMTDSCVEKEVKEVKGIDPIVQLRSAIFNAYIKRLNIIFEDETLKAVATRKLIEKIETDDSVSVAQLMSIVNQGRQNSTVAMDSLISVLKPTPNATSPLFQSMDSDNESEILKAFDGVSGSEAEAVSGLIRLLRTMTSEKKGTS